MSSDQFDPIVTVIFQAQKWVGDTAMAADRDPSSAEFQVHLSDVTDVPQDQWLSENNNYEDLLPNEDSLEADLLAEHENAPNWVQEWAAASKGPFYVRAELNGAETSFNSY